MKKFFSIITAVTMFLSMATVSKAEESFFLSLDGEWGFQYYASDEDVPMELPDYSDTISVPADIELSGFGYPGYYFEEGGWGMADDDGIHTVGIYTKSFKVTKQTNANLVFDSVKDSLVVTLNGETVGMSDNAEIGCVFPVTLKLGKNEIVAVVTRDNSGINKADNFAMSGIVGSVYITSDSLYADAQSHSVTLNDSTLFVDDEELIIRGVRYTPSTPENGDVMSKSDIDRDLQLIKDYGFNTILTSAAPDYLYQKTEELGLYVVDEANVYLPNLNSDMESSISRIEEMVKRHRKYPSIIMWSLGSGDADRIDSFVDAVSSLDSRPIMQNVSLADTLEVFGNIGTISDWVDTLGEENAGGFVKEFADKELYTVKHIYDFETKDRVSTSAVRVENGEITYKQGTAMLGDGSFEGQVTTSNKFAVLAYISYPDADRVIFQSKDGKIKLETIDGQGKMTINQKSVGCSLEEGLFGIVYGDGEAQLYAGNSFKNVIFENVDFNGEFIIGNGDGDTAIRNVKIYDGVMSLDEILTDETELSLLYDVDFSTIKVINDYSYEYLAYGGDFGDNPNSYYKSLKGLFSSLREPHPEAMEIKALFEEKEATMANVTYQKNTNEKVDVRLTDGGAEILSNNSRAIISLDGSVTSYVYKNQELLLEPLCPTMVREGTISEYETGSVAYESDWRTKSFDVKDNAVTIELLSDESSRLNISYYMTDDDILHVSMRTEYSESATKPTFVGFVGKSEFSNVSWYGLGQGSSYPDRRAAVENGYFEAKVSELSDNYAVPQENGNRFAYIFSLYNDENSALTFSSPQGLECVAHDYPFDELASENHDEDLSHENASYVRVGGYIAGVGTQDYKLNNSYYGFSMEISPNRTDEVLAGEAIQAVYINGERFTDFAPNTKNYVYRTNSAPDVQIIGEGEVVEYADRVEIIADEIYTIYLAPTDTFLSDLSASSQGEVSFDGYFGTNGFIIRGDRYYGDNDKTYQKGIAMKNNSEVVYDVSKFDNNVFTAIVSKDSSVFQSGKGFNRAMFDAEAIVSFYLDGELVHEESQVSMFSQKRQISIDVSSAKELKIVVTAPEKSELSGFEDAVLADAKFVPKGPIVSEISRENNAVSVTVVNTDEDNIDVTIAKTLGSDISIVSASIARGLYHTLTLDEVEDEAQVIVYVGNKSFELN